MLAGFAEKLGFADFVLKGVSGHGVGLKVSSCRLLDSGGPYWGYRVFFIGIMEKKMEATIK